jgi:uncharacterized membrane protein YukC
MEISILKLIIVQSEMSTNKDDLLNKILEGLDLLKQKDTELTNEDIVDRFVEINDRLDCLEENQEVIIDVLDIAALMADDASEEECSEEGPKKAKATTPKPKKIKKKDSKKRSRPGVSKK